MKRKAIPENTRISGRELPTTLSSLPERFTFGPHTEAMSKYLSRRWAAHSYGWYARCEPISFNPEWKPEPTDLIPTRDKYRWVEHPSDGLRFIGNVQDIRGSGDGNMPYFDRALVKHTGWFTDNFKDSMAWGQVYQLPARDGKSQYVPAYCDSDNGPDMNDGAVLDFHSITDDLRDAIRWADSMAEHMAEREREYQAKEDAKMRLEEIAEEIATTYATFKTLAREIRSNCDKLTGMDAIKQLIRAEYSRVRASVRKLRAEYRKVETEGISYY